MKKLSLVLAVCLFVSGFQTLSYAQEKVVDLNEWVAARTKPLNYGWMDRDMKTLTGIVGYAYEI